MKKIILLIFSLYISALGYCQLDSQGRYINAPAAGAGIKQPSPSDREKGWLLTDKETVLAYGVLFCLLVIILIEVWLIKIMNIDADNSVKLIVITLVLLGTLFTIMAGYNEKILAPVFGLFGTIIGYLFGKSNSQRT